MAKASVRGGVTKAAKTAGKTKVVEAAGGTPFGSPWVGLDSNKAPASESAGPNTRLLQTACTVVPAEPLVVYELQALMAPEKTPPEKGPGVRAAGMPIVVELPEMPETAGQGCSIALLTASNLGARWDEAKQPSKQGGLHRRHVKLRTTTDTKALAVLLATQITVKGIFKTHVSETKGASALVRSVLLERKRPRGATQEELVAELPPDPLRPADPHHLRVHASIGGVHRDGLLAPQGSRYCWNVAVGDGDALTFWHGASWERSAWPHQKLRFLASVGEETVYEQPMSEGDNHWVYAKVELGPQHEGHKQVCFATEGDGGHVQWGMWGNPQLVRHDRAQPRPHTIILVSVDTLRADRLGAYGYQLSTSPWIDSVAEQGLVFESHVAQTGWTLPSHVSMLTGVSAVGHGLTSQVDAPEGMLRVGFLPDVETLANSLRNAGYETHGVVSAPYLDPIFGFHRGFDSYEHTAAPARHSASDLSAPRVTASAQRILDRAGGRPLFLFLHYWDVHYDYLPPRADLEAVHPEWAGEEIDAELKMHPLHHPTADFIKLLAIADATRPPLEFTKRVRQVLPLFPGFQKQMSIFSDLYDGEVHVVDRHLAELSDYLEGVGRGDALFVITSDHGEGLLEHGTFGHGHNNIHSEGLVVPLIIRGPGIGPKRHTIPSSTVDIPATVMSLAGLDVHDGMDGEVLTERRVEREITVGHDGMFSRVQATRGRYRMLTWGRFGPEQLFDLRHDPEERNDVAHRHLSVCKEMRREVAEYLLRHGRGVHVAVVGGSSKRSVEIELIFAEKTVPPFVFGPEGQGDLFYDDAGKRVVLSAAPEKGELVALTVLVPNDIAVSYVVKGDDGHVDVRGLSEEMPHKGQLAYGPSQSPRALPAKLSTAEDRVYLWRSNAGTRRRSLVINDDVMARLRALGYVRPFPFPVGEP